MPGFIFIKSSTLVIASEVNDFSKKWYDAIAYGVIVAYLILNPYAHVYIFLIFGMIILPFLSPFLIRQLRNMSFFRRYMLKPEVSAWDYVFSSPQSYWVILHLKDGRNIGGVYSTKSFTSSFPYKQDIYLEEIWGLDENEKFTNKIERSAGLWIVAEEISSIEFFVYEEEVSNE